MTILDDETRKERVDALLTTMRQHRERFDMALFIGDKNGRELFFKVAPKDAFHTCGTTFCICGFAAVTAPDDQLIYLSNSDGEAPKVDIVSTGSAWLGLSPRQADRLFYRVTQRDAEGYSTTEQTTFEEAEAVLIGYRDTGKVQWLEDEEAI